MNLKTAFGYALILLLGAFINIQLSTELYADTSFDQGISFQYQVPIACGTQLIDSKTLTGPKNFFTGYPAQPNRKTINAVIEIPAGQNAKWEVSEDDGKMYWEIKKGKPRVVSYLPYPFNYGMIPSTLQSTETGGDGDPIDVLILGPALPRGSIVQATIIGVLRLKDDGERDDKLLAIHENGPFKNLDSLDNLNSKFPGVLTIIETWFTNYKGIGKIVSDGFGNKTEAQKLLSEAILGFKNSAH
jgi:inorganic pyrophosphatase